jgi:hypothetical protein
MEVEKIRDPDFGYDDKGKKLSSYWDLVVEYCMAQGENF